ncbi:MAG: inositol monophosphatase [Chloroflexi bacterium]|nr:inositol monophosphatase [Chloroflexota bacterium]
MPDVNRYLEAARDAASKAGQFLLDNFGGAREVYFKDLEHKDPASSVDQGAERIILESLKRSFPDHSLISEERGPDIKDSDFTWFIDPLDGTVNYLHGYRNFAVSIGLVYRGDIVAAAVNNPICGELFSAAKGRGAHLNGARIRVSSTAVLAESLLSVSFPYPGKTAAFDRTLKNFASLSHASQALRRDGSTALSLCNVACGRIDGFLVGGSELWDYVAGILILDEAGGRITDFNGAGFRLNGGDSEIVASNGVIHDRLLASLDGGGAQ